MEISNRSKKIRVIIIEDEEEIRRSMIEFLSKSPDIEVCAFFTSGFDIISEIKFYNPDVVITDFMATDISGIKALKAINVYMGENRPKIILTTNNDDRSILEESLELGIDYYMKKPLKLSLIKDVIFFICKDKERMIECNIIRKIRIKNLLKSVGVPVNILGYKYMEDAIFYMLNSNKVSFLSEIYRKISDKYDTSLKCVEVSIGNAVKKVKNICNDNFKAIFGFCGCNPSNSVFLSSLKEKIVIEEADTPDLL